jgi:Tol biopolymer transport system component
VYLRDVLNNSTTVLASVEGGSATYPRADRNLERIVYVSSAPDLAVRVLNLYERSTGQARPLLELATTGLIGAQQAFAVSGDGRYLVFGSSSDNFVPEDQNGRHDVFRLDIDSGEIVRVSVDVAGLDSGGASFGGRISDNGLRVAFRTNGGNWLPMGAPGNVNGFVKDLSTGELILANAYDGFPVGDWLSDLAISGDGSTIVFRGLGAADAGENGLLHVYRRRLDEARTQMVDVNALGFSSNGYCHIDALNPPILSNNDQFNPSVSDDGRHIAFSCQASNLLPEADGMHIYVRTFAGAPPLSAPVPIPAVQPYAMWLLLGLVGTLGLIASGRVQRS